MKNKLESDDPLGILYHFEELRIGPVIGKVGQIDDPADIGTAIGKV